MASGDMWKKNYIGRSPSVPNSTPNYAAANGEGMINSRLNTALLKHLPTKGLEINTVMTRVKAEVAKMTKNDQRPWTNSDLTTEVYLAPVQ